MALSIGDVTETKLFVAAAYAAHSQNHPMGTITQELDKCPIQSAGRPLMPEEAALRELWLGLAFLSCEQLAEEATSEDLIPSSFRDANSGLVRNLLDAKALEASAADPRRCDVGGYASKGTMEAAVMMQSLRIVYLTADVLEDVENAGTRADAKTTQKATPGPYIRVAARKAKAMPTPPDPTFVPGSRHRRYSVDPSPECQFGPVLYPPRLQHHDYSCA